MSFAAPKYLVRFGRRESLVEVLDGHAGRFAEPLAERPRFGRFLTLAAMQVDRQADDEPADSLILGQLRESTAASSVGGSPRVVLERAGDADFGIGHRDADANGAVVDAGDSHVVTVPGRSPGPRGYVVSGEGPGELVSNQLQLTPLRSAAAFPRFRSGRASRNRRVMLVHAFVVHEEAVQHRQQAEVARPGEPRAFDGDDGVVVAGNERVVAAVVALAAGEDAELEVRRRQLRLQIFPARRPIAGPPGRRRIRPPHRGSASSQAAAAGSAARASPSGRTSGPPAACAFRRPGLCSQCRTTRLPRLWATKLISVMPSRLRTTLSSDRA